MRVICGDLDQTMVEMTAQRIKENAWRAEAQVTMHRYFELFYVSDLGLAVDL